MSELRPKTLPPSMRSKRRYLVFEIISENPVEYKDFIDVMWKSTMNFIGELGLSETQIRVLKNLYDKKSQRGVIKCKHDVVEKVRASLSLIQIIGESRAIIHIVGVTGTIKSARNKYLAMRDLGSYK